MSGTLALFLSCLPPVQDLARLPIDFSTKYRLNLPSKASISPLLSHKQTRLTSVPCFPWPQLRSRWAAWPPHTCCLHRGYFILPVWLSLAVLGKHCLLQSLTLASFPLTAQDVAAVKKGFNLWTGAGDPKPGQSVEEGRMVASSPLACQLRRLLPTSRSHATVNTWLAAPSMCVYSDLTSFPIKGLISQRTVTKNKRNEFVGQNSGHMRGFLFILLLRRGQDPSQTITRAVKITDCDPGLSLWALDQFSPEG